MLKEPYSERAATTLTQRQAEWLDNLAETLHCSRSHALRTLVMQYMTWTAMQQAQPASRRKRREVNVLEVE
jgi:hypothetical protein